MSRVFAYCRVSTTEQSRDNQIHEIRAAGFDIAPQHVISERINGSVAADRRPGFSRLRHRLAAGDVLVVTKLDRLGRNVTDIHATVGKLATAGIRIHCLALGRADLTGAAGRIMMGVLGAVAEFERGLLLERTTAGVERARAAGKFIGRPRSLDSQEEQLVLARLAAGVPVAQIAKEMGTSRQTVMRTRDRSSSRS
ncbi:recombinase family protein [Burkholderia gladioli]|uniref:recombinase family protein n=1 Tax=Burkholderia gladioli TaxID=28095 RepID=UPI000F80028B|nr:recombinase family protein [Burkholderia gladioli]